MNPFHRTIHPGDDGNGDNGDDGEHEHEHDGVPAIEQLPRAEHTLQQHLMVVSELCVLLVKTISYSYAYIHFCRQ